MLSAMIVIGLGAGVLVLCVRIADSRPSSNIHREVSYEENAEASENYEHWNEPIQRAISTRTMANMSSTYDPEFVVLWRCDYQSEYCRGNGADRAYLRETKWKILRVWFKDRKTNEKVYVDLKNHTECDCSHEKSGERQLWHRVQYHMLQDRSTNHAEDPSTNHEVDLSSTNNDPSTNNAIDMGLGDMAADTQPLTSLKDTSIDANRKKSEAESSSANSIAQRLHLRTMLLSLLMLTYTSL